MKRIAFSVFLLICILLLSACGGEPVKENEAAQSTPVQTAEPTPLPTPTPTPEPVHDPGPYFDGFLLHYADDEGHDIRNGSMGVLQFDENGVFTSGDAELDAMLIAELEKNVDPSTQTRFEMLKTMYDYLVWNFGYRYAPVHEQGETGWEAEDAKYMLNKGKGNCYSYGALMSMFARSLGYQAQAVAGTFKAGEHSWTEIEEGGECYICDAEFQACNDPYSSRFFHTYYEDRSYNYKNPNRQEQPQN